MPSRRRGPEGAGWLPPLWRDGHKGRPYNSIFSQLRWPGLCQAAPLGLNAPTPRVQPKIWVKISPSGGGGFPNFNPREKRRPSPGGAGARRRSVPYGTDRRRAGEGSFHSMGPGGSFNLRIRVESEVHGGPAIASPMGASECGSSSYCLSRSNSCAVAV